MTVRAVTPLVPRRPCRQCGVMFDDIRPRLVPADYCSAACHAASKPPVPAKRNGPVRKSATMNGSPMKPTFTPRECAVCGTTFQRNIGHQKYCSKACRVEAQMEDRTCGQCAAPFRASRSTVTRFCSTACANRYLGDQRKGAVGRFGMGVSYAEVKTCEKCGTEFTGNKRFCSRKCHMTKRHDKRRADGHLPWSIKNKGEEQCRNCDRPAHHLHHIVPRSVSKACARDVHANGLPLCWVCHQGWHHRTVTIAHQRLSDEEFANALEHGGLVWVERHYPHDPVDALFALDELMNRRRVSAGRGETVEERAARVRAQAVGRLL